MNKLPPLSLNNRPSRLVQLGDATTLHAEVEATCFVQHARALSQQIYATAIAHGWWDEPLTDLELISGHHAELSEAYEALRVGNLNSAKIDGFTAVEEELADAVIRILGHGAARGWDVAGAIVAKVAYNEGRAYKHGGKKF